MGNWAIYGATGYSGAMAARHAVARGEKPLLMGRNAETLAELANELGLDYLAFSLDNPEVVQSGLESVDVLVNAAGPFVHTWRPLVDGCLKSDTHYLDITGEVGVLESMRAMHDRAVGAGVALVSGVAFDVIPSDCLAAHLHSRMPDATHLTLAIGTNTKPSHGTASTVALMMSEGSFIREQGELVSTRAAEAQMQVDFGWDSPRETRVFGMPWGDVSTAYHSTGIENISTYLPLDSQAVQGTKMARSMPWLFNLSVVRGLLVRQLTGGVPGPDEQSRAGEYGYVWGSVSNGSKTLASRVRTEHPYTFTALGIVESAMRTLADPPTPGFHSPVTAFGADYILDFEGSEREDCDPG